MAITDPAHTKKHQGPLSTAGHRGDLPVLVVDNRGDATEAVTAPHLTVAEIRGRSIMVHTGGDNYSDTLAPLAGEAFQLSVGPLHPRPVGFQPTLAAEYDPTGWRLYEQIAAPPLVIVLFSGRLSSSMSVTPCVLPSHSRTRIGFGLCCESDYRRVSSPRQLHWRSAPAIGHGLRPPKAGSWSR